MSATPTPAQRPPVCILFAVSVQQNHLTFPKHQFMVCFLVIHFSRVPEMSVHNELEGKPVTQEALL